MKLKDLLKKTTAMPWSRGDTGKPLLSAGTSAMGFNGMVATFDAGDYARSKEEGHANADLTSHMSKTYLPLLEAAKELIDGEGWATGRMLDRLKAAVKSADEVG